MTRPELFKLLSEMFDARVQHMPPAKNIQIFTQPPRHIILSDWFEKKMEAMSKEEVSYVIAGMALDGRWHVDPKQGDKTLDLSEEVVPMYLPLQSSISK